MAKRNFSRPRLARLMAGLTMDEAAKALGSDQTNLLRSIETGRRSPSVAVLKQMAELYHCSADFLLGLTPIRQRADELWNEKDEDEAFLHAVRSGTVAIKKPVEYQVPGNALLTAEDSTEYGCENEKAATEETLEVLLVKFRSAYPKGNITVEYTEDGATVSLIRELKTEPLTATVASRGLSSVRETVYALVKRALES